MQVSDFPIPLQSLFAQYGQYALDALHEILLEDSGIARRVNLSTVQDIDLLDQLETIFQFDRDIENPFPLREFDELRHSEVREIIEEGLSLTFEVDELVAPVASNSNALNVVEDTFLVPRNSSGFVLDVLDNDHLESSANPVEITSVSLPSTGGSLATNGARDMLFYTPPTGFIGEETLTYTVTDSSGNSDEAEVSISVTEMFSLPEDAGVINVLDYGAIPDDGQDDAAAIQRAIDDNDNDLRRTIYFPNGQYDIIEPLAEEAEAALFVRGNSRTSYWGESREGVVFKVADDHPDFQDPENPKAIFGMQTSPGFGFHSPVRNMTFNVGRNNEGAIGVQYFSNNGGTLGNVRIISEESDGQRAGVAGLDLRRANNGPLLIDDVEIIGFDAGIQDEFGLWGSTMTNIYLEDQNIYGYNKGSQTINIRNLTSINDVPAINMRSSSGALTLVDANLQTISESIDIAAIQYDFGSLFIRNLETSGYSQTVVDRFGTTLLDTNDVNEYSVVSNGTTQQQENLVTAPWSSETTTLNLPVPEVPDVPWEADLSKWAGPHQFGGVAGDGQDDTAALQAAIDSGANTIYFPGTESWDISRDVYFRGDVERVISFSRLQGDGKFIVVDQDNQGRHVNPATLPETILFEHMWAFRDIEHQSDRVLAISGVYGASLEAGTVGTGDIIAEDYLGNIRVSEDRRVWVSQLNTESGESPITDLGPEDVGIVNDGGQLYIFGLKTEKGSIKIDTFNGGTTELLGAHIAEVGNNPSTDEPIFRSQNSQVSYVNLRTSSFADDNYQTLIEEIQGEESLKTLREAGLLGDSFATGDGVVLPVYVGW